MGGQDLAEFLFIKMLNGNTNVPALVVRSKSNALETLRIPNSRDIQNFAGLAGYPGDCLTVLCIIFDLAMLQLCLSTHRTVFDASRIDPMQTSGLLLQPFMQPCSALRCSSMPV